MRAHFGLAFYFAVHLVRCCVDVVVGMKQGSAAAPLSQSRHLLKQRATSVPGPDPKAQGFHSWGPCKSSGAECKLNLGYEFPKPVEMGYGKECILCSERTVEKARWDDAEGKHYALSLEEQRRGWAATGAK